MEKEWRKSSRLFLTPTLTCQISNEGSVARLWWKLLVEKADGFRRGWILKQMTAKAKKFRITTFSHEIFIVRVNRHTTIRGFCPKCETEVEILTFDTAVSVSGIGGREVIRQIAADEIHAIETANGHLLVCKQSLVGEKKAANEPPS